MEPLEPLVGKLFEIQLIMSMNAELHDTIYSNKRLLGKDALHYIKVYRALHALQKFVMIHIDICIKKNNGPTSKVVDELCIKANQIADTIPGARSVNIENKEISAVNQMDVRSHSTDLTYEILEEVTGNATVATTDEQ